ncbi:8-oxo-dGTP diphosphatase MutT [Serratia sp. M24T3]|uniref:8-oxo-dGTP diphosphatase n=1 Tax=Rouxiella sp. WC2420 TaxID=3234145 RepID=A0AB39VYN9_9GAMM|nr:8-oxo-dGTP diphosphatase MutT [Serratia sp. M24T3]
MKQRNIAVGIIRNAQKEIFLTLRDPSSHMAGFWEFPGGKIESGETPVEALVRELQEEVGIDTRHPVLIRTLQHTFPDRIVNLHFFIVEQWSGEPYGKEGQPMRWVAQSELKESDFPPANAEIVIALQKGEI